MPPLSEIIANRIAARRLAAVNVLHEAQTLVEAEGGQLVVFGSLVEGGFDEHSDLDVALLGLNPDRAVDLASQVGVIIGMRGFAADIIPEQFLSDSLRQRIDCHGKQARSLE